MRGERCVGVAAWLGPAYGGRMAVLSVDLAFRRWVDLGVVVLERTEPGAPTACEIVMWNERGVVEAEALAERLDKLATERGIELMLLDGPQAWKSRGNGLQHARVSERQLNTAAKTGLPGMVKPVTYRRFAEFCVDVYDGLCRRGWQRLTAADKPGFGGRRVLVESYPHAAWKSLGLRPLAAKRKARISDLAEAYGALKAVVPFTTNRPPNHDQLQAIVGGLAGLELEARNSTAMRIVGHAPKREEGQWREGYIVLPAPRLGVRWGD